MRDKNFYINAIKMDLMRVVYAAGDLTKEFPLEGVREFLQHAESLFDNIELTDQQRQILQELISLNDSVTNHIHVPRKRLQWAEKILTLRARLY